MPRMSIHRTEEQTRVVLAELSRMREDALTSRERALLHVALTLGQNLQLALRAVNDIERAPARQYAEYPAGRLTRAVAEQYISGPITRLAAQVQGVDLPDLTSAGTDEG